MPEKQLSSDTINKFSQSVPYPASASAVIVVIYWNLLSSLHNLRIGDAAGFIKAPFLLHMKPITPHT